LEGHGHRQSRVFGLDFPFVKQKTTPDGQDRSRGNPDTVEIMWQNGGRPVESLSVQKKDRRGWLQIRSLAPVDISFVGPFACVRRRGSEQ
jgi:hypothetical protein